LSLLTSIAPLDTGPLPSAYVIEDEPVIRKVIRNSLRERDYPVAGFESAEAFLSKAQAGPQLLVVDKNLPGMSGIDLVENLRKQGHPFEAILITGYADQDSAIDAVRLGFYRYIRKPFDLDVLLDHVDGAARRLARQTVVGADLDRADALFSQYALLGRLAHEINNPLDFVQNNITFLSQQLPTLGLGPTDQFKQLANALLEMGIGAGRLCKVGHALSRVATVNPRHAMPTDAQTLIETQAVTAQDRTGFCGRVVRHFDQDLPTLALNASLTGHIVLTALVELMHTANRLGRRSAPAVTVRCRSEQGCLLVSLRVEGEETSAKRLADSDLDLYKRAVVTEENSSLDLTICRSLLVASGGELTGYWQEKGCVALSLVIPAEAVASAS
jgi:FixJ family two-component response regulator